MKLLTWLYRCFFDRVILKYSVFSYLKIEKNVKDFNY